MMNYYIFEDQFAMNFSPITDTRPGFELRCGAFSFIDRILQQLPEGRAALFVRNELAATVAEKYPQWEVNPKQVKDGIWLLGNVIWDDLELDHLLKGPTGHYYKNDRTIGARLTAADGQVWVERGGPVYSKLNYTARSVKATSLLPHYLWDIISFNEITLINDCQKFEPGNAVNNQRQDIFLVNPANISLANIEFCKPGVCIDASQGPVIIEENVKIGAGASIAGPVFIGYGSHIAANANIRPGTVAGPMCNLGGEISQSILQGYSNKSHNGFLGNSYLGEWVNLGAGTNNSNLKNNYQPVTINVNGQIVESNILHVGAFIGDHCKTALGTKINTGSTFGPVCSIISRDLTPSNLPPFTFFRSGEQLEFQFDKFLGTASTMMIRREQRLSDAQIRLFKYLHKNRLINPI